MRDPFDRAQRTSPKSTSPMRMVDPDALSVAVTLMGTVDARCGGSDTRQAPSARVTADADTPSGDPSAPSTRATVTVDPGLLQPQTDADSGSRCNTMESEYTWLKAKPVAAPASHRGRSAATAMQAVRTAVRMATKLTPAVSPRAPCGWARPRWVNTNNLGAYNRRTCERLEQTTNGTR
jgi:hypothetical protein